MHLLVTHNLNATSGAEEFTVTVQEIDVAHNIWGKSVPSLKLNTTRKKPRPGTGAWRADESTSRNIFDSRSIIC